MEPSYVYINTDLHLSVNKANLVLRTAFGTSHSSTTTRTNAIITIKYQNHQGNGEVGLPPKKKHCYLATYDEIEHFFGQYCAHVKTELQNHSIHATKSCKEWLSLHNGEYYKPFENIPGYFTLLRKDVENEQISFEKALPLILLKVLDTYGYVDADKKVPEYQYAAKCGIEMAIFDLWGSLMQKPLFEMAGIHPPLEKKSFYTAALNEDIAEIEKAAEFGLKYTNHLKIKLDNNIERAIVILERLTKLYTDKQLQPCSWSVDANSAWNPESSLEFLHLVNTKLPDFLKFLYMVEQPFPVELAEITKNAEQWKKVKAEYEKQGIYVFADESVSTADHIPHMKDFVHGVNIKLEKAGGVRGALRAIIAAKSAGLKIWLGCMVSTRLSCTCSAHLLSLSEIGGDLDGDLLVDEPSQPFNGGFEWGKEGRVILSNKPGLGLTPKS